MIITLKGHANIRHYFAGGTDTVQLDVSENENLLSIICRAGIPEPEIMLLVINEKVVTRDYIPKENDVIEIFPILAGG